MIKILIPIFVVVLALIIFLAVSKPLGIMLGLRTYWPAFLAGFFFMRYQMQIRDTEPDEI